MIKLLIIYLTFQFHLSNKQIVTFKKQSREKPKSKSTFNNVLYLTKNSKKNLILGIITRYSLNMILPFFNSLIQANITNCDVVIFIKNVSESLVKYLKSIGVIVYKISNKYNNLPPTKIRWGLYKEYLEKMKNEYNLVFIADIRDTIFQKNIFQYYKMNKSFIVVSIEDGTLNERFNKNWITNFAGEERQKKIEKEKIICFGSILGTFDKILNLSNILWEKIKLNTNSTDQGIGNYLFYYERIFNDCLIKSDNFGPVMTVGLTTRQNIILDLDDNILNFKREIAAVVHQYDRKPELVIKVKNKYLQNNKKYETINYLKSSEKYINNDKTKNIQLYSNYKPFSNEENKIFYINNEK